MRHQRLVSLVLATLMLAAFGSLTSAATPVSATASDTIGLTVEPAPLNVPAYGPNFSIINQGTVAMDFALTTPSGWTLETSQLTSVEPGELRHLTLLGDGQSGTMRITGSASNPPSGMVATTASMDIAVTGWDGPLPKALTDLLPLAFFLTLVVVFSGLGIWWLRNNVAVARKA